MTPAETARVLAKCAAYDQRTVGEADVMAWHENIGDLDYGDAMEAVRRHYRESTERIMPAHVRQSCRAIRNERRRLETHEARALPGRFEDDAIRDLRINRGMATCAEVLGPILARLAERREEHRAKAEALREATGEHPNITEEKP